ncbi:hypothetical protein GGS20DRAFT_582218 [Poronia punctata]|nr:hypothetical protein GGS20DRAFT_582218 [Poronia punctata]
MAPRRPTRRTPSRPRVYRRILPAPQPVPEETQPAGGSSSSSGDSQTMKSEHKGEQEQAFTDLVFQVRKSPEPTIASPSAPKTPPTQPAAHEQPIQSPDESHLVDGFESPSAYRFMEEADSDLEEDVDIGQIEDMHIVAQKFKQDMMTFGDFLAQPDDKDIEDFLAEYMPSAPPAFTQNAYDSFMGPPTTIPTLSLAPLSSPSTSLRQFQPVRGSSGPVPNPMSTEDEAPRGCLRPLEYGTLIGYQPGQMVYQEQRRQRRSAHKTQLFKEGLLSEGEDDAERIELHKYMWDKKNRKFYKNFVCHLEKKAETHMTVVYAEQAQDIHSDGDKEDTANMPASIWDHPVEEVDDMFKSVSIHDKYWPKPAEQSQFPLPSNDMVMEEQESEVEGETPVADPASLPDQVEHISVLDVGVKGYSICYKPGQGVHVFRTAPRPRPAPREAGEELPEADRITLPEGVPVVEPEFVHRRYWQRKRAPSVQDKNNNKDANNVSADDTLQHAAKRVKAEKAPRPPRGPEQFTDAPVNTRPEPGQSHKATEPSSNVSSNKALSLPATSQTAPGQLAETGVAESQSTQPIKRGRGRPRKYPLVLPQTANPSPNAVPGNPQPSSVPATPTGNNVTDTVVSATKNTVLSTDKNAVPAPPTKSNITDTVLPTDKKAVLSPAKNTVVTPTKAIQTQLTKFFTKSPAKNNSTINDNPTSNPLQKQQQTKPPTAAAATAAEAAAAAAVYIGKPSASWPIIVDELALKNPEHANPHATQPLPSSEIKHSSNRPTSLLVYAIHTKGVVAYKVSEGGSSVEDIVVKGKDIDFANILLNGMFSGMDEALVERWCREMIGSKAWISEDSIGRYVVRR